MQHSNLAPVTVHIVVIDGNPIEVPYCGTFGDMARNYVRSLPQNSAILQRPAPAQPASKPTAALQKAVSA